MNPHNGRPYQNAIIQSSRAGIHLSFSTHNTILNNTYRVMIPEDATVLHLRVEVEYEGDNVVRREEELDVEDGTTPYIGRVEMKKEGGRVSVEVEDNRGGDLSVWMVFQKGGDRMNLTLK